MNPSRSDSVCGWIVILVRACLRAARPHRQVGSGDGINPMDLINPRDYRDPIASARTDARLPILLADGIFLLRPVTFEGVLIPKAEVNEFSLPDSPWKPKGLKELRKSAESGEIVLSPGEEPDDRFKDSDLPIPVLS